MNYRAVKSKDDPDILIAMLVYEHEVEVYRQRGADFIVQSVMDVVGCLPGGLTLAGRWNDLDRDQMEEGLHRNRHESQPTPSIDMD